jgi:hypothetical protein
MNVELMQQSRRRRHRSDRGSAWQAGRYLDPHREARSRVHGLDQRRAADDSDGIRMESEQPAPANTTPRHTKKGMPS